MFLLVKIMPNSKVSFTGLATELTNAFPDHTFMDIDNFSEADVTQLVIQGIKKSDTGVVLFQTESPGPLNRILGVIRTLIHRKKAFKIILQGQNPELSGLLKKYSVEYSEGSLESLIPHQK